MQRINEDIKTGQLKQVYLLYGEEAYLRKQYKDRLKKALCADGDTMNFHYCEGKDVNVPQIIDLAETLPFLAERRVLLIENSGLFKRGGETLADYLKAPCDTAFFIFAETEVDKRSKLYKTVQSRLCYGLHPILLTYLSRLFSCSKIVCHHPNPFSYTSWTFIPLPSLNAQPSTPLI